MPRGDVFARGTDCVLNLRCGQLLRSRVARLCDLSCGHVLGFLLGGLYKLRGGELRRDGRLNHRGM